MDFFEEQELARKRSRRLGVLFAFAVAGVVAAVYAFAATVALGARAEATGAAAVVGRYDNIGSLAVRWWDPELFAWTALATIAVIGLGSLYKIAVLRGGGEAVAKSLGGRRVDPATTHTQERRLLNVVEEMAIASGVPAPDVYILDNETGINAFAAGLTPSDATIGVTDGTAKLLRRDELQGVVAHEFSHILHGDMRINLRAIGLLHGIFMVALLGRLLMRSARGRDGASIAVLGLALFAIGSVGVFFGRIIQSAISRQREVLADASAVQFTRDPNGLAGALKKIGSAAVGSIIGRPEADEASHMFFSDAVKRLFKGGLLRTHPPLRERILKLEPSWDGSFPDVDIPAIAAGLGASVPPTSGGAFGGAEAAAASLAGAGDVAQAISNIGQPTQEEVAVAKTLHAAIPPHWHNALRRPSDAQALVFGLLLAQDDTLRAGELKLLRDMTDDDTVRAAVEFHTEMIDHTSGEKLALVDVAVPTLRRLSLAEFDRFVTVTETLIRSDGRVDLFEYTLQRIVERHLRRYFRHTPPARVRHRALRPLIPDAEVLLSTLARVGQRQEADIQRAFGAGVQALGLMSGAATLRSAEHCTLDAVDRALSRYEAAAPKIKKSLMFAAAAAVMADSRVTDNEIELIRAIGDAIDCPVPPFVRSGREHSRRS